MKDRGRSRDSIRLIEYSRYWQLLLMKKEGNRSTSMLMRMKEVERVDFRYSGENLPFVPARNDRIRANVIKLIKGMYRSGQFKSLLGGS